MTAQAAIAVVTGASSGFGAAITRRLSLAGFKVVAGARRQDRLEEVARATGAIALPLDVRDAESVRSFVAGIDSRVGQIDVLVNNAGLALGLNPAHQADLDEWERMVDTNIKGLMYCTRALLPGMVERRRGHIVNIGSVAGEWPYPGGNAYGATKAFVRQFSLNLKADLVGTGVRISEIEPGMAETEFSLVRFGGDAARAKAVYAGVTPLSGEDIADTVHWIVSRPPHVNINTISLMPECQGFSAFTVKRKG